MAGSKPPEDDEDALFRAAMAGVDQLGDRQRVPPAPPASTRQKPRPSRQLAVDGREGRADGVNDRQLADLRGGRIAIGKRIDLHGLRSDPARHAITRDIERAAGEGVKCVLIVHGKGKHSGGAAVLTDLTVQTLATGPSARHVLAFCPALPRDGGAGALYVLLRRQRAKG